jgi:lysozyme
MQPEMVAQIKQEEGLDLLVYDDANERRIVAGSNVIGNPTIGWGRCLSTKGITQAEAQYLLDNDIAECEAELAGLAWWSNLDAVRRDVVTNMAFNLGVEGLLTFHNMITAIERKDYAAAADEALNSKWASQVGQRAATLARQLQSGIF